MPLSPRQEVLYGHNCDVWGMAQTTDQTSGRRTAKTYTLLAAGVPCYFQIRQSTDERSAAGGIEGDNIFTRDKVHFADDIVVDSDFCLVNKTLDVDGNPSQNYGRFWIVAGQPSSLSRQSVRRGERRAVEAVQVEDAPEGVTV